MQTTSRISIQNNRTSINTCKTKTQSVPRFIIVDYEGRRRRRRRENGAKNRSNTILFAQRRTSSSSNNDKNDKNDKNSSYYKFSDEKGSINNDDERLPDYDEVFYQFGEAEDSKDEDEVVLDDNTKRGRKEVTGEIVTATTTTTTMGANESKPNNSNNNNSVEKKEQQQSKNRPIDITEAKRTNTSENSKTSTLHPRGTAAAAAANSLNKDNNNVNYINKQTIGGGPTNNKDGGGGRTSSNVMAPKTSPKNSSSSSIVIHNNSNSSSNSGKKKDVDFPALTLRQVVKFAVPALGAVLCDPVMTLVDTACVGRISASYLAALGPNTSIFGFVAMIFQFLTIATTGMVSRNMDAKDAKGLAMVISDALTIAILMGILSAFLMIVFAVPLLDLMQTQPHVMQPAVTYLRTRAFTMPCFLITLVGTATCLGQRDSQSPMKIFAFAGTLNLVLDLYLVIGPPKMGIAGAALATAVAQTFAALIFLRKLSRNHNLMFRLPTRARSKPFITAGGVLSVRSVCIMLFYSYAAALASTINVVTIAAHQVVAGIVSVAQFCPEPLSACAQSVLATAGPRNANGFATLKESLYVRKAGRLLLLAGLGLGAGVGALCASILAYKPEMFTKNLTVIAEVHTVAPIVFFSILIYCVLCVTDGLVFATGRIEFAAITQVINFPLSAWALWFSVHKLGTGLVGIWFVVLGLFILRVTENLIILARDLGPAKFRKVRSSVDDNRISIDGEGTDVENQKIS